MVVEKKSDADHPARPQLGNVRHDEACRPDEVAGDAQQDLALGKRFGHEAELVLLEVAQAAVDQLRRRRGGRAREIGALDEQRRQAAPGCVARDPGAVDAPADDEEVDHSRGTIAERPAGSERASCWRPSSAARASGPSPGSRRWACSARAREPAAGGAPSRRSCARPYRSWDGTERRNRGCVSWDGLLRWLGSIVPADRSERWSRIWSLRTKSGCSDDAFARRTPTTAVVDSYFLRNLRTAASCAASSASSLSTAAISCLSCALARASSALRSASLAFASSRSLPRIAVSASTVISFGCTSRMPPATKISCSSPPPAAVMRTAPGLMRVMRGVWRGELPR